MLTPLADNTPPKVNPFHLLSNPEVTSPGPALPSHLRPFANSAQSQQQQHHPALDGTDQSIVGHYQNVMLSADGQSPLHITKVTKDTVHLVSAQQLRDGNPGVPKKMIQKVTKAFRKPNGDYVETSQSHVLEERRVGHEPIQGAPPSPPASVGEVIEPSSDDDMDDDMLTVSASHAMDSVEGSEQHGDDRRTSIFTSNLTTEPGDLGGSPIKPFAQTTPRRSSWNSGSSRTGSLAVVRKAKEKEASERERKEQDLPAIPSESVDSHAASDTDATIPPPPRISRRSTNPNPPSPTIAKRSPLVHSQSTFSAHSPTLQQSQVMIPGVEGAALDSAILAHSEQLRRERLEKRQKKASAAENAAPPIAESSAQATARPDRKATDDANKVLVGNLIGEDHVNYVLMYNMLTGIRIGVSPLARLSGMRCHADDSGVTMSSQDEATHHRRGLHGTAQVLVRHVSPLHTGVQTTKQETG